MEIELTEEQWLEIIKIILDFNEELEYIRTAEEITPLVESIV